MQHFSELYFLFTLPDMTLMTAYCHSGAFRAHELNPFLLRHFMGAYCSSSPPIPPERIIGVFHQVFAPERTSRTWHARLLEMLFGYETAARAFIDVSCQTFHGSNLDLGKSDHDLLKPPKELIGICHTALADGPQILRIVASSLEMFQKLISSMALACQRVRCFGDPYSEYFDMLATCIRSTRSVYDFALFYQDTH